MSNYRRLISYIYAYEGGVKRKNVGFAKLEIRNGQCKLQVNVRNVYIGSQDTAVYLLCGTEEILVGKIFIRNGAGEFRALVQVNNVAGSGHTMDQCYGLTVHNMADSWQSYTTIWEDAVAHTAEVALEDATSEKIESKEMKELPEARITPAKLEHAVENHKNSVGEAIEAEIEAQTSALPSSEIPYPDLSDDRQDGAELGTMEIKPMEVTPITGRAARGEAASEAEGGQEVLLSEEQEKKEVQGAEPEPYISEPQESEPGNSGMEMSEPDVPELQEPESGSSGMEMSEPDAPRLQKPESGTEGMQIPESGISEPQVSGPDGKEPKAVRTEAQGPRMNLFGMPGWWGQPLQSARSQTRPGHQSPQRQAFPWNQPSQGSPQSQASSQLQTVPQPSVGQPQTGQQPQGASQLQAGLQPQTGQPAQGASQLQSSRQLQIDQQSQSAPQLQAGPQFQTVPQPQDSGQLRPGARLQTIPTAPAGPQLQTGPRQRVRPQRETSMSPQTGQGEESQTDDLETQQKQQLKQLEQEHLEEEPRIEMIWQQFFKRYPKIQAFDYNGGCEILTIKPQDIGLLPRETWGYGNNSFLLHGYYNHRYLIFARLNNPRGEPRYLLGVPGHYYSNEKYMASMFGFPNFVLSKIQPAGDGRFGYWYTDVRMGS